MGRDRRDDWKVFTKVCVYLFIYLYLFIFLYFFFVCMCLYTVHFTSGSDPRSHEATMNGVAKKAEKFFWTFFATALHVVAS